MRESKKENLIKQYIPLCKYIAGKLFKKYSYFMEYDDLVNIGVLGLIDAYKKYDDSKGASFKTYAFLRIKGSIADYAKSQSKQNRKMKKIINNKFEVVYSNDNSFIEESLISENLEVNIINNDVFNRLNKYISKLNSKKQYVINLIYYQYYSNREVATLLNVSLSRVCQIVSSAINDLKYMIKKDNSLLKYSQDF